MTVEQHAPLIELDELARRVLAEGIKQLETAGSPLHPFFLDETGKAYFLFDNLGGVDPMAMAMAAIQENVPDIQRCALLVDTRIGYRDGKKWDALLAMACDRDEDEGFVLAQRYVPKGFMRKFRLEGEVEQIAKSKNFIRFAAQAQDAELDSGAARILEHVEAVYVPSHDYRNVSADEFGHLDIAFYDTAFRRLQASGYSHLADVEDVTLSNAPGGLLQRIMIRSMLSADGATMASAYDPKLTPAGLAMLGAHPLPVIDFETEFTDGSFVVTSNASTASAIGLPPMVLTQYLPAGTPVADVLATHLERLQAFSELSDAPARQIGNHEELIRSQNRLQALKAAFRNELGGVSAAELAALSSGRTDLSARMHGKILERRARQG